MRPIIIFTGPTLSPGEGQVVLDAIYRPPASQGDIYRATQERPWGIGIIDGYFERVPAVWHKEILWALSQGTHVFGSASMGALRAAELTAFGMEGVGSIFKAFNDGVLEDDDEVTVVHGPAETGYRLGSEAMVNIRATLDAALQSGIISQVTLERVVASARAMFYPDRAWPTVLASAAKRSTCREEIESLKEWLPKGRVDQKRADALEMLRTMSVRRAEKAGPKEVSFRFQHTDAWEQVRRSLSARAPDEVAGSETYQPDAIQDECRLLGAEYGKIRDRLLIRVLAAHIAVSSGDLPSADLVRVTTECFRTEWNLLEENAFANWLLRQRITEEEFAGLMVRETRIRRILNMLDGEIERHLPDHLRLTGHYSVLEARAREKQSLLVWRGVDNPSMADTGLTETELFQWYFQDRLGSSAPAQLGPYAAELGFSTLDAFRRMVLREWCYRDAVRQSEPAAAGSLT